MFKNKTVIKLISITITAVFLQQQVVWAAGDISLKPGELAGHPQSNNTFNLTTSERTTSKHIVPQAGAKDLPISISQEAARLESSYINGGKEVVVAGLGVVDQLDVAARLVLGEPIGLLAP